MVSNVSNAVVVVSKMDVHVRGGGVLIRLSNGDSRRGLWRTGKGNGDRSKERVGSGGMVVSWDSSGTTPTSPTLSPSSAILSPTSASASVDVA